MKKIISIAILILIFFICVGSFAKEKVGNSCLEADIAIVVDKSGSITGDELVFITEALEVFIHSLPVDKDLVHISVISFNKEAYMHTDLSGNLLQVAGGVFAAVYAIPQGSTQMSAGLHAGYVSLLESDRSVTERHIVLLSDGDPSDGTLAQRMANDIHGAGIRIHTIYTVSEGEEPNRDHIASLEGIATPGDFYHVFYSELVHLFKKLDICT